MQNMIHEPWPDMKKVFKKLWEHKLNMKAQGMQMKARKQQSTAHNSKMLHELLPDRKKTIKTKQGHKLSTKKIKHKQVQNQQSTAHNSKNDA